MENEHRLPKGKIITAIIAVVLLASMAVGWFMVKDNTPPEKKEEKQSGSYFELFTAKAEDIKSVTVKTEERQTTVSKNKDGITVSPEIEGMNEAGLRYYIEGYTAVYAMREIKDGYDRLSEYGIKENANYFEIVLSDNSKHRFCVGNSVDGRYYCLKQEDKTVWLVPSLVGVTLMSHPEADKENTESFSVVIDYENIYYVGADKAGENIFEIKRVGNTTALPYNFYSSYEITYPFSDIAYTTEFTEFLKSLSAEITPMGHMGSAAENLEKYGIDSGYKLTVKDSTKTHIFRFGNRSDVGVYVTYNDYPYVYLVSDALLAAVENADVNNFATPYIDLYEVDYISEIMIKSGEKAYNISVDAEKGKYNLNKKELTKERFDKIYGALIDIIVYNGVETELVKGDAVMDVTYKLRDGSKYNRTYYACGSSMVYLTNKESGVTVTVKKAGVDGILEMLDK